MAGGGEDGDEDDGEDSFDGGGEMILILVILKSRKCIKFRIFCRDPKLGRIMDSQCYLILSHLIIPTSMKDLKV